MSWKAKMLFAAAAALFLVSVVMHFSSSSLAPRIGDFAGGAGAGILVGALLTSVVEPRET
jgi:hypothetical protein